LDSLVIGKDEDDVGLLGRFRWLSGKKPPPQGLKKCGCDSG
jgi:hypothetical protein